MLERKYLYKYDIEEMVEAQWSNKGRGGKRYLGDKSHLPTGSQIDVVIPRMWEWAEWSDWIEQGNEAKVTLRYFTLRWVGLGWVGLG
jgi:hypothetical protein